MIYWEDACRYRRVIKLFFLTLALLVGGAGIVPETSRAIDGIFKSVTQGRCVTIKDKNNVVLENEDIGPCVGPGIIVFHSNNVIIRNVTIHDTVGVGVLVKNSNQVVVQESHFQRNSSSIYVVNTKNVNIENNFFLNVQGPKPRGQFVQFNGVTGRSRISCNVGLNEFGKSAPEDAVNLFRSSGTQKSPMLVDHNVIVGGGPSKSGGGIMLGDFGGGYVVTTQNVLIDPGQYGIAVSGGKHLVIDRNVIYAKSRHFTNVGIYVWGQSNSECKDVTVSRNRVNWRNHAGQRNEWWDGRNCGKINFTKNEFDRSLSLQNDVDRVLSHCVSKIDIR